MPGGLEVIEDETIEQDLADCRASGDCGPACQYVLSVYRPRFVIVAKDANGVYENREATDTELEATCREIYFESESDFSDTQTAKTYLILQAASEAEIGA